MLQRPAVDHALGFALAGRQAGWWQQLDLGLGQDLGTQTGGDLAFQQDPLLLVRKNKNAFAPDQRIYLDGASHGDWGFNKSARKIFDVLHERGATATFYEPTGGHSDRVPERLVRGLTWALGKPVADLP